MNKEKRVALSRKIISMKGGKCVELTYKMQDKTPENSENDILDLVEIRNKVEQLDGKCKAIVIHGIGIAGIPGADGTKFSICYAYKKSKVFSREKMDGKKRYMIFTGWEQNDEDITCWEDLDDNAKMFVILLSGELNLPVIIKTPNGDIKYN